MDASGHPSPSWIGNLTTSPYSLLYSSHALCVLGTLHKVLPTRTMNCPVSVLWYVPFLLLTHSPSILCLSKLPQLQDAVECHLLGEAFLEPPWAESTRPLPFPSRTPCPSVPSVVFTVLGCNIFLCAVHFSFPVYNPNCFSRKWIKLTGKILFFSAPLYL